MKPSQQFINMISALFQKRQKAITIDDMVKHNQSAFTFYSISEGRFSGERLIKKTEAFSDQIMIEIERGANKTIVGTPVLNDIYTRTTAIKFDHTGGKGFIYWQANDSRNNQFYIVKLLADDGTMQIKIMTADQKSMTIHNVCQLPG
jgi:hypothetical protein